MAVPKFILDSKGSWEGQTTLHQSWLPPDKQIETSATQLHIDTDEHSKFAILTYNWHHEGKRHEGHAILCGSSKTHEFEVAWVDSWHQNSGILSLNGKAEREHGFKSIGSYTVENQKWGWTIAFALEADTFTIKMENVTPDGKADWAVDASYKRS